MTSSEVMRLVRHAPLVEAMQAWASATPRERLSWRGASAAEAFRQAALPGLRRHGVVRVRLLDDLDGISVPALRRLVAELARQIGFLLPQTFANNRTALIEDQGKNYSLPGTRGHETNAELAFHSDRCDAGMLLYVRCAAQGGGLSLIGYEQAARALERRDPDALDTLCKDYPIDLRSERIFQTPEWSLRPILWTGEQGLRGHYIRRFIHDSQRHPDCPRLTPRQIAALDAFDAVLETLRPSGAFAPTPGELLLFDSYRVMHARQAYIDHQDGRPGRLAIRAWIAPYHSEPLPDFLLPLAGALEAGCFRGGVGRGRVYHQMLGRAAPSQAQERAI